MGYEEIKETIFCYFRGKTDYKQESEVFKYLSANSDGRKILERLEREWFAQEECTPLQRASFRNLMDKIRRRRRRRIFISVASSAAAVLVAALFSWYHIASDVETQYYTFNTEVGEKVFITLPDSSKVWLNSGSDLKYSEEGFRGRRRKVELSGEAFFDVRSDRKRPFIVHAGDASITVTGTEFNVRSGSDGNVQTALVSGSVKFSTGLSSVPMKPGELLTYNDTDRSITKESTDLGSYVDWVEMKLDYPEISVSQLFNRLEMIYGIDINYIPEKYGNKIFRIILSDKDSIEDVLDAISVMIPIDYNRSGNCITVLEK